MGPPHANPRTYVGLALHLSDGSAASKNGRRREDRRIGGPDTVGTLRRCGEPLGAPGIVASIRRAPQAGRESARHRGGRLMTGSPVEQSAASVAPDGATPPPPPPTVQVLQLHFGALMAQLLEV